MYKIILACVFCLFTLAIQAQDITILYAINGHDCISCYSNFKNINTTCINTSRPITTKFLLKNVSKLDANYFLKQNFFIDTSSIDYEVNIRYFDTINPTGLSTVFLLKNNTPIYSCLFRNFDKDAQYKLKTILENNNNYPLVNVSSLINDGIHHICMFNDSICLTYNYSRGILKLTNLNSIQVIAEFNCRLLEDTIKQLIFKNSTIDTTLLILTRQYLNSPNNYFETSASFFNLNTRPFITATSIVMPITYNYIEKEKHNMNDIGIHSQYALLFLNKKNLVIENLIDLNSEMPGYYLFDYLYTNGDTFTFKVYHGLRKHCDTLYASYIISHNKLKLLSTFTFQQPSYFPLTTAEGFSITNIPIIKLLNNKEYFFYSRDPIIYLKDKTLDTINLSHCTGKYNCKSLNCDIYINDLVAVNNHIFVFTKENGSYYLKKYDTDFNFISNIFLGIAPIKLFDFAGQNFIYFINRESSLYKVIIALE
jgi:hypothetical protein